MARYFFTSAAFLTLLLFTRCNPLVQEETTPVPLINVIAVNTKNSVVRYNQTGITQTGSATTGIKYTSSPSDSTGYGLTINFPYGLPKNMVTLGQGADSVTNFFISQGKTTWAAVSGQVTASSTTSATNINFGGVFVNASATPDSINASGNLYYKQL